MMPANFPNFRDLPLRHKLISIIVATSCVSLLLASVAFVAYDKSTFRAKMVRDISVEADIIAMTSTAALTFEDFDSARQTLGALYKEPSVVKAALESADGKVVAQYIRDSGTQSRGPLIRRIGHMFTDERLAVRREIRFDGDLLGYVYIESDLEALKVRVNRFLMMVVTIIAAAMLVVIFASSKLQRLISDPILKLAQTAKRISREKDYTLRASKRGEDEVGALIDGFNEMLGQIEQRDAMLERHRDELESEVAARTGELRDVNRELESNQARLRAIVEGTASKTGADFFDALSRSLASALGMRWVVVGRLRGGEVRAMALWNGEEVRHDLVYPLKGTPCADAVKDGHCVVESGVIDAYPADTMLAEMGAESYVGYVLRDQNGRGIGLLSAIHDGPLPEVAKDNDMLRVFASRAAAELERLEVEADLQRSESSTRAILESAADGIITVSADGIVETINPAAEQIFGCDPDAVKGRSVSTLMRFPGDGALEAETLEHPEILVGNFIGTRGEIEGIRADGTVFPMNIAAGEMQLGDQTLYTAIVRDVTREHELDRMKADFISTVSHEIRTPLACIMSSAKILNRNGETRPEVTPKFSNIIIDEGKRLTRLINDLLDLSKMDSNSVEWNFADEQAAGLVEPIIAAFQAQAAEREIEIGSNVGRDVPPVYVDRDKAIQVLTNLVSNAVKFSDPGGKVTVSAHRSSGQTGFVCFSVKDSGVGIAKKDQSVIFERFKQIGDVQTDRPQGTGLGLPICAEIVQFFGGKLWVESEEGEGSTFTFTVPISTTHMKQGLEVAETGESVAASMIEDLISQSDCHAEKADAAKTEDAGEAKSPAPVTPDSLDVKPDMAPSVLVVDDDEPTRKIIAFHLKSNGFEVLQASGGEEALQMARARKPDLITLDVMMPDLSGYDVLEALRTDSELKEVPVLLLSVLPGDNHSDHALRVGANAYLSKPISASRLLGSVNRLLGGQSRDVLIIDDDLGESAAIKTNLAAQGYAVVQAFNGKSGVDFARRLEPDLIILGSPASAINGQEILEALRNDERTAAIPVVLLTAMDVNGTNAMSLGADLTPAPNETVRAALAQLLSKLSWAEQAGDEDEEERPKILH